MEHRFINKVKSYTDFLCYYPLTTKQFREKHCWKEEDCSLQLLIIYLQSFDSKFCLDDVFIFFMRTEVECVWLGEEKLTVKGQILAKKQGDKYLC